MTVVRKLLLFIYVLSVFAALPSFADSQLTIEINSGVDNPTPIAISPFAWGGVGTLPQSVSDIIESDLRFSGLFDLMPKADMLSYPNQSQDVFYRDWKALGRQYLLIGNIKRQADKFEVSYFLYDIVRQRKIFARRLTGGLNQLRDIAHKISDQVFITLTDVRGVFSTKMLYVSAKVLGGGKYNYKLYLADFDGERRKLVFNSPEPILSPTWSPSGKEIAYVSFEDGRPAIFLQRLASGEREKLTHFKGMNSAPAFSPDGNKLAMVLSKDGSPDIYIMDLMTKKLKKLKANSYGIDTEPAWMPDSKSLVFTSNRGGKPQIYQVDLAGDAVARRLTFDGSYNARAQPLLDGSGLILVHRQQGRFHIARFDPKRGRTYVLTSTDLDESPSIAANGSMVIYATKRGGRGVLAVVSVEGDVKTLLPSSGTDNVREPSWSPFIQ